MNNNPTNNNADRRASGHRMTRFTTPINAPNQSYGEDISFGDNTSLGVDMPIGLDMSDMAPAGVGATRTAGAVQAGMPGLYGVDMTDTVFADVDALHAVATGQTGQPALYGIDMTAEVHANLADALGEHRYTNHDDDRSCASCQAADRPRRSKRATHAGSRARHAMSAPHRAAARAAVPHWRDQVEWTEYADPAADPLGDQEADPDLTMADILINLEAYTEPHRTYLDPHTHPAFSASLSNPIEATEREAGPVLIQDEPTDPIWMKTLRRLLRTWVARAATDSDDECYTLAEFADVSIDGSLFGSTPDQLRHDLLLFRNELYGSQFAEDIAARQAPDQSGEYEFTEAGFSGRVLLGAPYRADERGAPLVGTCAADYCIVVVVGGQHSTRQTRALCTGQYCIAIAIGSDARPPETPSWGGLESNLDSVAAATTQAECGECGVSVAIAGNASPLTAADAMSDEKKNRFDLGAKGGDAFAYGGLDSCVFSWGGTGSLSTPSRAIPGENAGGEAWSLGHKSDADRVQPLVAVAVGGHGGDCGSGPVRDMPLRGGPGGSAWAQAKRRCAIPGEGGLGCIDALKVQEKDRPAERAAARGDAGEVLTRDVGSVANECDGVTNDLFA